MCSDFRHTGSFKGYITVMNQQFTEESEATIDILQNSGHLKWKMASMAAVLIGHPCPNPEYSRLSSLTLMWTSYCRIQK